MAKRETPVAEIETPEATAARLKSAQGVSLGKGAPTPTRREQEAARRKPLVPSDRKEAARQAKTQTATARERARIGMAAGEERYLLARDKGVQRRYIRDYVDARFSIGEAIIPVMFAVILLTLVPNTTIQTYLMLVLYAFVIIVVIDILLMGNRINKRLREKYGTLDRGLRWYGAMRALQLRPMRLPKPQVKRGQFPS
ncbi:DUF3043 domain-containing protein [Subtercola boreus]|uniref:DUF3043 domain-containing protein n=1 Tax=Subtercola boreus TaxID=120213 RepID=A0A3E0WAK9_9MICO|nr:DUF3043 domain-containing protein [Subtercola boreus]RFA21105.1 hypothetical protein B7R24_06835 [Subtercola boreus]RFA21488.1 hypothetical protein B7R23_06780 [Subtercola boreus]RFA27459.1 hypothetical protein B7R25_06905 [Subtercola boreus]